MSAPKTPEGRAAALTKRRETMRARPWSELRGAIEDLGKRFAYAEGRPDLRIVGCIIQDAARFVTETPLSDEKDDSLQLIAQSLGGLERDEPIGARECSVFTLDPAGRDAFDAALRDRLDFLRGVVAKKVAPALKSADGTIDFSAARSRVLAARARERSR